MESYQRQQKTLLMLKSLAMAESDLRNGSIVPDADADCHFREKLVSLVERNRTA